MAVTPVRTWLPSISVTYPTSTPGTSVMAFHGPGRPANGSPSPRARGLPPGVRSWGVRSWAAALAWAGGARGKAGPGGGGGEAHRGEGAGAGRLGGRRRGGMQRGRDPVGDHDRRLAVGRVPARMLGRVPGPDLGVGQPLPAAAVPLAQVLVEDHVEPGQPG